MNFLIHHLSVCWRCQLPSVCLYQLFQGLIPILTIITSGQGYFVQVKYWHKRFALLRAFVLCDWRVGVHRLDVVLDWRFTKGQHWSVMVILLALLVRSRDMSAWGFARLGDEISLAWFNCPWLLDRVLGCLFLLGRLIKFWCLVIDLVALSCEFVSLLRLLLQLLFYVAMICPSCRFLGILSLRVGLSLKIGVALLNDLHQSHVVSIRLLKFLG